MDESGKKKYRVLVLGGCGFIGRHLVDYLVSNKLVSKVRVVDKLPPAVCWMNKHHQEIFSNDLVEFKSANLINPAACQSVFEDEENFDFVINLAAETRLDRSDAVYKEGILKLSLNCANEAAKRKVLKYVELSTGEMCPSGKDPVTEKLKKVEPWTAIARSKYNVEVEISKISGLNYVILRPAIVYGVADKTGITPRLVVGAVYKHLGEMMKLLWNKDLKMNTVHVTDVCRAIWFVCTCDAKTNNEVFNVVDKSNTTQGLINDILSDILNINHDYFGTALSVLAIKTNGMEALVDDINDKHMGPWSEICAKYEVTNTPLNPYLHKELLTEKNLHLDGSKLENMGFSYQVSSVTKERILEVFMDYIQMGLFPSSLVM